MPTIYVARSNALSKWAADVGLTKHLFKVGIAEGSAAAAVKALDAERACGQTDWRLVANTDVEAVDEAASLARIAVREMRVDPNYYPRLRGTSGVFKVKLANVENRILMRQAYAQEELKITPPKPADVGEYLIALALGEGEKPPPDAPVKREGEAETPD
jgi:hypothetical protein